MKEKIALLTEMSKEARRFLKSGERPISLKEKEEGVNIQSILDLETFETLLNEMLDTYRYEPSTLQSHWQNSRNATKSKETSTRASGEISGANMGNTTRNEGRESGV